MAGIPYQKKNSGSQRIRKAMEQRRGKARRYKDNSCW
jgi:hypothetical protein